MREACVGNQARERENRFDVCESVTERAYDTTRGAVAIGQHYEQTCILMIDMT